MIKSPTLTSLVSPHVQCKYLVQWFIYIYIYIYIYISISYVTADRYVAGIKREARGRAAP